ncbi:MAG: nickel-binding protein [bacterium]
MALYRIRRNVGDISKEDMDAASMRAIVCAVQFPGLKWHRSYWDREAGNLDCLYEASDPTHLEEHARVSRIPCDEVREVTEVLPETYLHG